MRKLLLLAASLLITGTFLNAQVISLFTFEDPGNNERIAAVGPNASSSGSTSFCQLSGTSGMGCNAGESCGFCNGVCYNNINLIVPNTGNVFSPSEVRISIDYRRVGTCGTSEVDAWFFQRGDYFKMGMVAGKLTFGYVVDNFGVPAFVPGPTITGQRQCWGCDIALTNGDIPNDGVWRNYMFEYIQADGFARLYVDGAVEYQISNPAEQFPGRPLYWSGAPGAIAIGSNMDGEGNNVPIIDNAQWEIPTALPVELLSFDAEAEGLSTRISWKTNIELNNKSFTVERSLDEGETFEALGTIDGAGNSSSPISYEYYDINPQKGSNYYRLTQTDLNGNSHTYYTVEVLFSYSNSGMIAIFPNPVSGNNLLNIKFDAEYDMQGEIIVYDLNGKIVLRDALPLSQGMHNIILPVQDLENGLYIVKLVAGGKVYTDKFLKVGSGN